MAHRIRRHIPGCAMCILVGARAGCACNGTNNNSTFKGAGVGSLAALLHNDSVSIYESGLQLRGWRGLLLRCSGRL